MLYKFVGGLFVTNPREGTLIFTQTPTLGHETRSSSPIPYVKSTRTVFPVSNTLWNPTPPHAPAADSPQGLQNHHRGLAEERLVRRSSCDSHPGSLRCNSHPCSLYCNSHPCSLYCDSHPGSLRFNSHCVVYVVTVLHRAFTSWLPRADGRSRSAFPSLFDSQAHAKLSQLLMSVTQTDK